MCAPLFLLYTSKHIAFLASNTPSGWNSYLISSKYSDVNFGGHAAMESAALALIWRTHNSFSNWTTHNSWQYACKEKMVSECNYKQEKNNILINVHWRRKGSEFEGKPRVFLPNFLRLLTVSEHFERSFYSIWLWARKKAFIMDATIIFVGC